MLYTHLYVSRTSPGVICQLLALLHLHAQLILSLNYLYYRKMSRYGADYFGTQEILNILGYWHQRADERHGTHLVTRSY